MDFLGGSGKYVVRKLSLTLGRVTGKQTTQQQKGCLQRSKGRCKNNLDIQQLM